MIDLPTESEPVRIIEGDCLDVLRAMPDECVRCCVTSPPYYSLRDYKHAGQIGLEPTPEAYVARLVEVFREVRRVLADDGTLWLNLGDSYTAGSVSRNGLGSSGLKRNVIDEEKRLQCCESNKVWRSNAIGGLSTGLMPKQLVGIPWRVAFALQADGWWLRQDIIWHKPNPMPESVRDRCTKAHEYVFLLAKSERYFYDADAVSEQCSDKTNWTYPQQDKAGRMGGREPLSSKTTIRIRPESGTRNRRSVWTVAPKPFNGAHFAVMPPALVEPCVRAGSAADDVVLDPFGGAGTVGLVSMQEGRRAVLIELNPQYAAIARRRVESAMCRDGLLAGV